MTVTMITAGLLGLLLVFLGCYVIAGRVSFKIGLGDGGNAAMIRRMRAQANFVEYVPIALILIALMENATIGPHWLLVTLAAALVIARLWHAQGLISSAGTSPGRFVGSALTMVIISVAGVACLGRGLDAW